MFGFPDNTSFAESEIKGPESPGGYSFSRVPGCISVPCNFKAKKLREYIQNNAEKCRILAKEYLDKQDMMRKVDKALAKKRA